ncbi:MAG: hypothetical protein M0Q90_14340 [Bacteroidales bacterium]|nr:hypothetical protein [Bacteroidales bacterium]
MWFEVFSIIFGSGGIVYGVASWFVSKRVRNNNFLSELQGSITKLTSSYTETLNTLVDVQRQNSKLLINQDKLESQNVILMANQEELIKEIEKLRRENKSLSTKLAELNKTLKHEKHNSADCADGLCR